MFRLNIINMVWCFLCIKNQVNGRVLATFSNFFLLVLWKGCSSNVFIALQPQRSHDFHIEVHINVHVDESWSSRKISFHGRERSDRRLIKCYTLRVPSNTWFRQWLSFDTVDGRQSTVKGNLWTSSDNKRYSLHSPKLRTFNNVKESWLRIRGNMFCVSFDNITLYTSPLGCPAQNKKLEWRLNSKILFWWDALFSPLTNNDWTIILSWV